MFHDFIVSSALDVVNGLSGGGGVSQVHIHRVVVLELDASVRTAQCATDQRHTINNDGSRLLFIDWRVDDGAAVFERRRWTERIVSVNELE